GKIEFDDQTTDEINFLNCRVGIGTDTPTYPLTIYNTTYASQIWLTGSGGSMFLGHDSSTATVGTYTTPLRFYVNYGERMRITTNGDVGIGIASPSNKLHVEGSGGGSAGIYLNSAVPSTTTNTLYNNGGTLYWSGSQLATGVGSQWVTSGSDIYYNSGNVGIGTTSPATLLELSKTDASPVLTVTSATDTTTYDPYIAFRTGATPSTQAVVGIDYSDSNKLKLVRGSDISSSTGITLDSSGNVGIGTTPSYPLHVSGATRITAGLHVGNTAPYSDNAINDFNNNSSSLMRFGQDYTHNLFLNWSYNATPANAQAQIGTYGYSNPIYIDASGIYIQSYNSNNVGIGTASPNSKLHIAGAIATALSTKTTNYTLTATDSTILGNANSGAITLTLPTTSGITGRIYTIKKIDSSTNAVTVDGYGSETIDGAATYSLSAQYKYVTIQSDGTNWVIIANN
ncbi:MAG: hypothetical protein NC923_07080, partial [Candidatus Omnitrophica bacterium]|nr:hypothetical protein [Candidatus Omnitrophota bacterium]